MRKAACLVLLLCSAGCDLAPVFQMTARDADARWVQGQHFVRREYDSVSVVAAFNRTWRGYVVFDVEIANRSSSTLLVLPESFCFTLSSSREDLRPALQSPVWAVDPETELARLDKYVAAVESAHATGAVLDAIGGIADAVVDIAAAGSRTREEQDREEQLDLERAAERHHADESYESTLRSTAQLRDYWAARALRRTHVGPWKSVGGEILLPAGRLRGLPASAGSNRGIASSEPGSDAVYTLTLHSPVGCGPRDMEFVVRKL